MTSPIVLTREQVRAIDQWAIRELGLPGIVLMENAGRGAAEALLARGVSGPIVICTGGGNNGGDGYVMARHLWLAGCEVRVRECAAPSRLSPDASLYRSVAERLGIDLRRRNSARDLGDDLAHAEWIVDALLGTGLTAEVRDDAADVIRAINAASAQVFAVDLPSGLDCDRGIPFGVSIAADVTATFVARKAGFENPDARRWTGDVVVVGIGVPAIRVSPG